MRIWILVLVAILQSAVLEAAGNGRLQIHFINVGQGDGALIISPLGETVLIDNGVRNHCERQWSYLQDLGLTELDYHIASHYHDDHIGCTSSILTEFALRRLAYDRGGRYDSQTFRRYVRIVGKKRRTAEVGHLLTLDQNSDSPVQLEFVAVNGAVEGKNGITAVSVKWWKSSDASSSGCDDVTTLPFSPPSDLDTHQAPAA